MSMEPNSQEQIIPKAPAEVSEAGACPVCHQPVLSSYYFCPNCGTKLNSAPLSTTVATEAWIYAFSAILPLLAYIFITKWPGIKYFKSKDPKAKRIGGIALAILIFSSIITIWLAVVWVQGAMQSAIDSVTAEMSF